MILQLQNNWCIVGLLCISFVGCSSVSDYRRAQILDSRLYGFSHAIRWAEFEKAQEYISMRKGQPKKLDLDYLKNIKVTKYQLLKQYAHKQTEAEIPETTTIYDIEYYFSSSNKIRYLRYEQLWWYDKVLDNWFLDSDLPQFVE